MQKYKQLVLGILGAVQKSSENQLEKDLLGALINVEGDEHTEVASEVTEPVQAPALTAPEAKTESAEPSPELQAPALSEAPQEVKTDMPIETQS